MKEPYNVSKPKRLTNNLCMDIEIQTLLFLVILTRKFKNKKSSNTQIDKL